VSSFEQRFYRTDRSIWARLCRNIVLAWWIASLICAWFTVGSRLRRASRQALKDRRLMLLDDMTDHGDGG